MNSKVIVITGGSRGIGAKTAMEAARRGFGVILTYTTPPLMLRKPWHAQSRQMGARRLR